LDYESSLPTKKFTEPDFSGESAELIEILKEKSSEDIKALMGLSDKLAALNVDRYRTWEQPFTTDNARQGLFAFKGDVYVGLDAYSFSDEDIQFAQDHLRILSGLYGVLRPLDLMQPYRLEMGTKLVNAKGKNLYEFWADKIANSINEAQPAGEKKVLVNLASNEYFSSVKKGVLESEIVTPAFYDWKNGKYKIISFFAKKARGYMAAWIIKNRITGPEEFPSFNIGGYKYSGEQSTADKPVFLRKEE
jgi:cytoplasmic iron level regulating protein YaaA (DUF328/UPF0246 family)